MLDVNLIRNQVLILHEAGPLAEAVIRRLAAEAERHAAECAAEAGKQPSLFDTSVPSSLVITLVRNVRGDLTALRRNS
jgi:hypothetical protein